MPAWHDEHHVETNHNKVGRPRRDATSDVVPPRVVNVPFGAAVPAVLGGLGLAARCSGRSRRALPSGSVDVVISNCVINLAADKRTVLGEAARVLRPGGRFAVSDVIADSGMGAETRVDTAAWTGCIGGALTETEYREALSDAGFENIEIAETHRVHPHATAAIIRARHPAVSSPGA